MKSALCQFSSIHDQKSFANSFETHRKLFLDTKIKIHDYLTEAQMLNENKVYSQSYSVQDQISETIKIENKTIENLLNKIYQDLIIKLSQSF